MFLLAFIAGVALGGLLNVLIYRLPRLAPLVDEAAPVSPLPLSAAGEGLAANQPPVVGETLTPSVAPLHNESDDLSLAAPLSPAKRIPRPQSSALHCTRSDEALTWRDSMPLVGWLSQLGRCRHCGKRLPVSFPLVELFTGLTFAAAWIDYGVNPLFYIYALYTLVLIVTMVIDWQHHDLYTIVLLAGAVLAVLGALVNPELDLGAALLGAVVGGGTLLVFYFIARLAYGEEALAFGDVELMIMLGLMVGYPSILGPLLLGPLIAGVSGVGLVFVRRKAMHDYIPIGASFCFATICALLLRDQLWHTLPLDNLAYWLGVITNNIGQWLGGLVSAH